jgi:hypothetical protein
VVTETVWYLGYEIEVCSRDFLVFAPNRDVACFPSMMSTRSWIRRHRKSLGTQQEEGGGTHKQVDPEAEGRVAMPGPHASNTQNFLGV